MSDESLYNHMFSLNKWVTNDFKEKASHEGTSCDAKIEKLLKYYSAEVAIDSRLKFSGFFS